MEIDDTPSVASIDLARHYGVSERTLYEWRKKGLIPQPEKTPGGRLRWRRSVLAASSKPSDETRRSPAAESEVTA